MLIALAKKKRKLVLISVVSLLIGGYTNYQKNYIKKGLKLKNNKENLNKNQSLNSIESKCNNFEYKILSETWYEGNLYISIKCNNNPMPAKFIYNGYTGKYVNTGGTSIYKAAQKACGCN